MIEFFGELLLVPLRPLVWIFQKLKLPGTDALLAFVFAIGRKPMDAIRYLAPHYEASREGGRLIATRLLSKSSDGYLHALLAWNDQRVSRQDEPAKLWIAQARSRAGGKPIKNIHMLLYAECGIAEESAECERLSAAILERSDFPPYATSLALYNRILVLLDRGELTEAERLNDFCLEIKEDLSFRICRIALTLLRGGDDLKNDLTWLPGKSEAERAPSLAFAYALAKQPAQVRVQLAKMDRSKLEDLQNDWKLGSHVRDYLGGLNARA